MRTILQGFLCVGLAIVSLSLPTLSVAAPRVKPPVPDFTAGEKPLPDSHDWTLGPTGLRGWLYAWKLESREARQIYITKVDRNSPSDGVFRIGDVILGIDDQPFRSDARIVLARAITVAEAGDGALKLIRWRDGQQQNVELKLTVTGKYSPTAPYDCPKSKLIFESGCRALAARMEARSKRGNPIERSLNALALLASGSSDYMPLVEEEARWAADYSIPADQGFHSWWYGYTNTFLAEYVLATGDRSVMPGLKRLSLEIAEGQSAVGTWGHKFADPESGILHGYGAMNSPGLSLTISLVLAREAGVSDPAVDRAIERSERFLSFYIGKGAIPYGDHHPWLQTHDDNGKCGAGAVLFDLLSNDSGAAFFSRMSTACHGPARDTGHTGNYFNLLWALPGVSRSGSTATGAWIEEFGWYLDFARRADGTFLYQGEPGTSRRSSAYKYGGWDSTGAYLLSYALPLRSLRLTGREPSVAPQLDRNEVNALIADGRDWTPRDKANAYEQRSTDELITALKSWSPVVREHAATALGKRRDARLVPRLLVFLESDDASTRLGACAALEALGPRAADAVPALTDTLADDDLWLRVQAGEALSAIGTKARSAVPDLLKLIAKHHTDDPRGMTQRFLAFLLFHPGRLGNVRGMLARSLDDVDRELLLPAVQAVLRNEDGRARGTVGSVYSQLSYKEIKPILPAVHQAIVEPAPSGVMFASGIRLRGLELLAKHRIREGLPLCVTVMEPEKWGKKSRITRCLKILRSYGGAARSQLPALLELEQRLLQHRESKMLAPVINDLRVTMAAIEAAPPETPLRSLTDDG